MKKEQLFTGLEASPKGVTEVAEFSWSSPLGPYVLDSLPVDLRAVADGHMTYGQLAEKHDGLLSALAADALVVDDLSQARTIQLDLLFMRGGFLPAGPHIAPRAVLDAIQAQCARFPSLDPHMSYELLIDVNSNEWNRSGNMRVFTEGELGLLERDFYLGHHLAEPTVRAAADSILTLIHEPDTVDKTEVLEGAVRHLDDFRLYMAQYNNLPSDAFNSFRRYHMGHPGGPRGASGAFMPSVQLLELALLAPTTEHGVYLDQAMPYFPQWSRSLIAEARESSMRGDNVVQSVLDGRLKLDHEGTSALLAVIDKFADFRMVHLGVTRKAIPEAFPPGSTVTRRGIAQQAGEADILNEDNLGTSGFSVRNVLTNSVYRLLAARRSIASHAEAMADERRK
ncbi:hypothetical protein [Streptomyces sp. NPDC047990]|uniref:hypothetical protein n=1 Tax=Streptomyces sp. NPDC047990 TaxID=3365496 RepID=UPI0037119B85